MKKLFALLLALCMLIMSFSALAEDAAPASEWNMYTLSVGNFELDVDGETIFLPLTLALSAGADAENSRGGVFATLYAGEEPAAKAVAALENDQIELCIDGMQYGISIPMEDIVSMLESEMGASLEDLMSGGMFPSAVQDTATRLTEAMTGVALSVAMSPEETLKAIGLTSESLGTETVTLFDQETEAEATLLSMEENTLAGLIDATSAADPAWSSFWAAFYDLFLTAASESGEEMTMEDLDALFAEVAFGFDAVVYAAENGSMTNMVITTTADGETIELPFSIASMNADGVAKTEISTDMTADGESVSMLVAWETSETAYAFELFADAYDAETYESSATISLDLDGSTTEDGVEFSLGLYALDEDTEATLGLAYEGLPAVVTADSVSYEGAFGLYATDGDAEFSIGMDTGLTLSKLPEGELAVFSKAINPLTAEEEEMDAFASDAQAALFRAVGVMMQNPELSELIAGLMG